MKNELLVCQPLSVAAYRFIQHLPREKQAMEMTEYGKHGKHGKHGKP